MMMLMMSGTAKPNKKQTAVATTYYSDKSPRHGMGMWV